MGVVFGSVQWSYLEGRTKNGRPLQLDSSGSRKNEGSRELRHLLSVLARNAHSSEPRKVDEVLPRGGLVDVGNGGELRDDVVV